MLSESVESTPAASDFATYPLNLTGLLSRGLLRPRTLIGFEKALFHAGRVVFFFFFRWGGTPQAGARQKNTLTAMMKN